MMLIWNAKPVKREWDVLMQHREFLRRQTHCEKRVQIQMFSLGMFIQGHWRFYLGHKQ